MANWVNLMDVIYPVGSIYLSASSTSPASIIGGSWAQKSGCVLACSSSSKPNGFAVPGNTAGNMKIAANQVPLLGKIGWRYGVTQQGISDGIMWIQDGKRDALDLQHLVWSGNHSEIQMQGSGDSTYMTVVTFGGGGQITYPTTILFIAGKELHNFKRVGGINAHSY